MITEIKLRAGSSPGKAGLSFVLTPVTIFVGPNNSGKSRALIEIEDWVSKPLQSGSKILENITFRALDCELFEQNLNQLSVEPSEGEVIHVGHLLVERVNPQEGRTQRLQIFLEGILQEASNPNENPRHHYSSYLRLLTLRLDGSSRLSLVKDTSAGDLLSAPTNNLGKLFSDDEARAKVRRIIFEAFGKYLVIDPTNVGSFRLRLSMNRPSDNQEEQGWDERARAFHNQATLVSTASDGVKAFVGIITSLVAGDPSVTMIDEPEAFLHPTLATRLGREVSSTLNNPDKRIFISTHSAHFLMGCVQSGVPLNIVRLTYDGNIPTSRLLTQDQLLPLMRNPLLRSIGVLNALFYNAVIVTEGDADRAFYQEINERLLQAQDPRAIEGCLFLNAQNKQTVWEIVKPLRELGIPAAGIVDIDVIKEGGGVWNKPMVGAYVPPIISSSLGIERSSLLAAFNVTGRDMKRDGGVGLLAAPEKEACLNFFNRLSDYGIFVVANGEVESWLQEVEIPRGKSSWLSGIFEAMGEDQSLPNYVRPSDGDVWDFIGSVRKWVVDPIRKGVPD